MKCNWDLFVPVKMALSMGSWNKRADSQGFFCEEMGEDSSGSRREGDEVQRTH